MKVLALAVFLFAAGALWPVSSERPAERGVEELAPPAPTTSTRKAPGVLCLDVAGYPFRTDVETAAELRGACR